MVLANYCECDLFIGENSKVGNSSFSIGSSRPETDSKVNDNTNSNHEVLDPDSLIVNTTNTTTDDLDNTIAEKNSDENITGDNDSPPSVIKLDNVKKAGTGNGDDEEQNLSSNPLSFPVTDALEDGAGVINNDNKKNIGQHHDCKRTDSKRRKRTVSSKIIQATIFLNSMIRH